MTFNFGMPKKKPIISEPDASLEQQMEYQPYEQLNDEKSVYSAASYSQPDDFQTKKLKIEAESNTIIFNPTEAGNCENWLQFQSRGFNSLNNEDRNEHNNHERPSDFTCYNYTDKAIIDQNEDESYEDIRHPDRFKFDKEVVQNTDRFFYLEHNDSASNWRHQYLKDGHLLDPPSTWILTDDLPIMTSFDEAYQCPVLDSLVATDSRVNCISDNYWEESLEHNETDQKQFAMLYAGQIFKSHRLY